MAEAKKNCFAYKENSRWRGECVALKDLYCKNEKCKFFKTAEQLRKENQR